MTKSILLTMVLIFGTIACGIKQNDQPKLQMTSDEIVQALVQMYAVNATLNINDIAYRDSTSNVYFEQIVAMSGRSIDVIKADFEKLQLMPDTLLVLQNRALDTLRAIQEKQLFNRTSFN